MLVSIGILEKIIEKQNFRVLGDDFMNVLLKTRNGYLNIDGGIKNVKDKNMATIMDISKAFQEKERVYKEKPMIGKITMEISK